MDPEIFEKLSFYCIYVCIIILRILLGGGGLSPPATPPSSADLETQEVYRVKKNIDTEINKTIKRDVRYSDRCHHQDPHQSS